jgi:predicted Zn-dependent protease
MKKFAVILIEENCGYYFSIDSNDRKEYTVRNKTGVLERSCSNEWFSRSRELTSFAEVSEILGKKINLKTKNRKDWSTEVPFKPGKLVVENQYFLDFLHGLDVMEWKVIFRAQRSRRLVINKSNKEKQNFFSHYSVLIKVRLKDQRNFIEVGEGGTHSPKFNQDGLISRVKEILDNHKQAEKHRVELNERVPVILNAGDGGILFHEILGHALEADYIYMGRSPISIADIGRPIMPKHVTVVTADGEDTFFGDLTSDDEGETPKSPVLIEKGVLKNIISDSFYRDLLDVKSCGHSRVEDFTSLPMPRMYALYLKPGSYSPEDLVTSTPFGVYAREFGEGKINFDKNIFYFNIRDARLIEKGKRTVPLGNIMVRGDIFETLNSIDMIGSDFRYDKGISYCHKNGQTVNVRVGQPSVKINNLYVTKDSND